MKARILVSACTDPYRNLALEEALLASYSEGKMERISGEIPSRRELSEFAPRNEAILFLWQNTRTVVIGRGQNAWRECRTALLEADGVKLARRTTGGGAVYHDLGNLNFSFLLPCGAYDLSRQLSVVQRAVRSFGIDCAFSGRNDLSADGRKFSGNAFRFTAEGALHHGTLLVSADIEKLSRYLAVSPEKLSARGVRSVPARIVNLSALAEISVDALSAQLTDAFRAEYGPAEPLDVESVPLAGVDALAERNASWDWNYGSTPAFDVAFSHRFPFGHVELLLTLYEGRIAACRVFTDAMDPGLSTGLEQALPGCAFEAAAMGERAGGEVGEWLAGISL